jgi:hypothetical protein
MIVRIALLLVSLSLLVHGVMGLSSVLGSQPRASPLIPAIEAVVGAQALLVLLFLSIKRRRRAARSTKTDRPTEEAASNTVPARINAVISAPSAEFRRLMLVNLPPYAALSALEDAPPLGAQDAVRSSLAQVLPGITFNDHGLGQFNGPDHSILMDLGVAPQVWAATVDVTGDAAATALRRLITQTGWRAYAPRLGRFITAEDLKR